MTSYNRAAFHAYTYSKGRTPNTANLEQGWRSLIPVESFTRDPADPTPEVPDIEVGIRWGKPADFGFDLSSTQQKKQGLEITEVPRYYFKNEIMDFTEIRRQYREGEVGIHAKDLLPNYTQGTAWQPYIDSVSGVLTETFFEGGPARIKMEELTHWISDSGIKWPRRDSNGEHVADVAVHYKFIMEKYLPFRDPPRPEIKERPEEEDGS